MADLGITNIHKASVLVEALPYIQKYEGKTIVVKYGGNAMINEELKDSVMNDIILLKLVGINVVLVHGGGPEINEMLKKTGKESKFVNGLRYTDEETMNIVQMVLCGKVNKDLVNMINRKGGHAVGISGIDGSLFQAKKLNDGFDYGYVGEVCQVEPKVVTDAIQNGFIPVVSTVAQGVDDDCAYNINADIAAAKLAIALKAEKYILLTDVRGILRDAHDDATLIRELHIDDVPKLFDEGIISGGMIPKVNCCVDAMTHGVNKANIQDGRVNHSILIEILSDEGVGTMITK